MKKLWIALAGVLAIGAAQASIFDAPVYSTGNQLKNRPLAFTDFKELAGAHPAENLSFEGMDGKKHAISDYKGKLLILDMWASWCDPCLRSIPLITELQKKFNHDPKSKVRFYSVSIDEPGTDVKDFLEENKFRGFETWFDPEKSIFRIIPSDVVPTAYFFDGKGNLVGFLRGYTDWTGAGVENFLIRMGEKYADPTKIKPKVKPPVLPQVTR